jgi:pimeloyl-ACP methyl ester carboxylesterase
VLYGHSFGAPVVVTFALTYPEETRGVVAASGYYYPTRRLDSLLAWSNVLPVLGPMLRNKLTPVEGAVFGKLAVKALFDPAEIPPTYDGSLRAWRCARGSSALLARTARRCVLGRSALARAMVTSTCR